MVIKSWSSGPEMSFPLLGAQFILSAFFSIRSFPFRIPVKMKSFATISALAALASSVVASPIERDLPLVESVSEIRQPPIGPPNFTRSITDL